MTPIDNIPEIPRTTAPMVAASAPLQLIAILPCDATQPPKYAIPRALADRANRFWDDGYAALTEVVVLADAAGLMRAPAIEPFLDRLLAPVDVVGPLGLETEPADERAAVIARLDRLAGDARLRRRYVALLRDLWGVLAAEWDGGGAARARAASVAWSARLAAGADPFEFIPEGHIARRETFAQIVTAAHRRGALLLTPLAIGNGHIVALPDCLSVAAPATAADPVVARRQTASEIAASLRPLSDATRLTILAQLAEGPLGVSELAGALHIAQPTASVHLRRLREAGLVDVTREGTKTIYAARPEAVGALLADAASRLTRSMAAAR